MNVHDDLASMLYGDSLITVHILGPLEASAHNDGEYVLPYTLKVLCLGYYSLTLHDLTSVLELKPLPICVSL